VLLGEEVLPPTRVASMVEDARGAIWIGQVGVVSRLDDTTLTLRLTDADGVPAAPIRALVFDADTVLWMASYGGGLARYDARRGVRRLEPRGRQFEQHLSALRIDRHDRFWLHGDGGITVLSRPEVNAAIEAGRPARGAAVIGAQQGVPEGNGGYPNTWFDAASGQWWVATVDGVVSVNTEATLGEIARLQLRIDDVRLDGASLGRPDTLRVPPSANAFEVRISAPVFDAVDLVRIRYRLLGHDREWLDAGTSRIARYASVRPGRYVFEARIERTFGDPGTEIRALPVTIEPWWWETSLARGLALLLGAAAVWALFQWRTRLIRDRNRALQQEIADRERAERQAAEAARELAHLSRLATAGELATSIAHELNQPLTAVMGNAQQARHLAAASDDENLRLTLDAVVDQSERAADVIRSLRAFVLKQQEWDPDVPPDAVVEDTLRLLRQELSGRSVAVAVRDDRTHRRPVQGSTVQLQQVLANLLLNAADAMTEQPPERRRATIVLRDEEPDAVRLSVADTGPGIPADILADVFQPFFTTKPGGLGLGLSLSRSIVEAHAGRLFAESPPEGGSVFHIVLPLAKP
jgi:signal transduction histidine kinase